LEGGALLFRHVEATGTVSLDVAATKPLPGAQYVAGTLRDFSEHRPMRNFTVITLACPPEEPDWIPQSSQCSRQLAKPPRPGTQDCSDDPGYAHYDAATNRCFECNQEDAACPSWAIFGREPYMGAYKTSLERAPGKPLRTKTPPIVRGQLVLRDLDDWNFAVESATITINGIRQANIGRGFPGTWYSTTGEGRPITGDVVDGSTPFPRRVWTLSHIVDLGGRDD
jgi:hypothetical protein